MTNLSPTNKPRIAVTMGDPAGVGPELCLRLLQNEEIAAELTPIVFGDVAVLQRVAQQLGWSFAASATRRRMAASPKTTGTHWLAISSLASR